MTYSPPEDIFKALENSAGVAVKFNDEDIGAIAGPQPLVSLSNSFVRTNAGDLETITTSISLNGKIALFNPGPSETYPSGLERLVQDRIIALTGLFGRVSVGTFKISTPQGEIFGASGVKVKSFNVEKSNDNWMFTADYAAELEFSTIPPNQSEGANALVTSTTDTWSIEPVEDYVWNHYTANVSKAEFEYHNPKKLADITNVVNIPQYRITHRLSAVGIPKEEGKYKAQSNDAYLEAKKWVNYRANMPFNGNDQTSSEDQDFYAYPYFTKDTNITSFNKTFLYNHLRTTNFSINEGSYELSDTWLAMPSGVKFIEDYTVESSNDDKNIKTVRVQGNIKGLSLSSFGIMTNSSVVNSNPSGQITLEDFRTPNQAGNLPDADIVSDAGGVGGYPAFSSSKYENALEGWLYNVKPYLYHRASTIVNSADRNKDYVDSTNVAGGSNQTTKPPGNPIYSYEKALRINPLGSTEGHDMKKGTISYSYEYSNKGLNLISGALSESISINDTGPTDVISETVVLGRALGPVIQSLGTQTATKRDVSIEVTVSPPTGIAGVIMTNKECPVYISGTIYRSIVTLIQGLKPFGGRSGSIFGNMGARNSFAGQAYISSDTHSWDATNGRYSRNVSWTYQHCQNNYTDYLEGT